jgi:polysaccharide pyruvyl transferase WcaK-like protein
MTRLLLLGAPFGTGNLGVNALAGGAIAVAARRFPDLEIALLDYGRETSTTRVDAGGRTLDVPLVNLRFSWKPWLPNHVVVLLLLAAVSRLAGRGAQRRIVRHNRWLARIASADAACAVSGGDSFSDLYGLGRLWYVALPQLLVLALGVPLVLLPQTIGPFRRPLAQRLAAFVLRRATKVNGRDRASVVAARTLRAPAFLARVRADDAADAIDDPADAREADAVVRFCPDLAFVLAPRASADRAVVALGRPPVAADGARRPLVALNASGLLAMGGYRGGNEYGLAADHGVLMERLAAWFIETADADVLLLPHVCAGAESDVLAAQALERRLAPRFPGRVRLAGAGLDAAEVKHLVGGCDFLVGARMHACIAALSQGIPAVGLAYSDKFAGVFESAGVPDLVADQRRLTEDGTAAFVAQAFDAREGTARRLAEALPAVRARVYALLDDLPRAHRAADAAADAEGLAVDARP